MLAEPWLPQHPAGTEQAAARTLRTSHMSPRVARRDLVVGVWHSQVCRPRRALRWLGQKNQLAMHLKIPPPWAPSDAKRIACKTRWASGIPATAQNSGKGTRPPECPSVGTAHSLLHVLSGSRHGGEGDPRGTEPISGRTDRYGPALGQKPSAAVTAAGQNSTFAIVTVLSH